MNGAGQRARKEQAQVNHRSNRATPVRWRNAALVATLALGGCSIFAPREPAPVEPAEPPPPVIEAPVATHRFPFDPESTGVVGQLQVTYARHEDTLSDIARRFNLGFDEVVRANPEVDAWLPGEGTRVVLPTQFVLPDARPEGIVVNLAALRLFYFPKPGKDGTRAGNGSPSAACSLRTEAGGVHHGLRRFDTTVVRPSGVAQPTLPMPIG